MHVYNIYIYIYIYIYTHTYTQYQIISHTVNGIWYTVCINIVVVRYGTVWYGTIWYGMAWPGIVYATQVRGMVGPFVFTRIPPKGALKGSSKGVAVRALSLPYSLQGEV